MKKIINTTLCILLCLTICFTFHGCSQSLTEDNVKANLEIVTKALKEFDAETLEKYVDSKTLGYIAKFSKEHSQYGDLGRAMFAELSMEYVSCDLDKKTVTLKVKNKDFGIIASIFASGLTAKYSTFEMVKLLTDTEFLDTSLASLTQQIEETTDYIDEREITLNIKEGKNLVFVFDEDAEDAVSGGAVAAISKSISF